MTGKRFELYYEINGVDGLISTHMTSLALLKAANKAWEMGMKNVHFIDRQAVEETQEEFEESPADKAHEVHEEVSALGMQAAAAIKDGDLRLASELIMQAKVKSEDLMDWKTNSKEDIEVAVGVFVEAFDEVYRTSN